MSSTSADPSRDTEPADDDFQRRWALNAGVAFTAPVCAIGGPVLWTFFDPMGSSPLLRIAWMLAWPIVVFYGTIKLWRAVVPPQGSTARGALAGSVIVLFVHVVISVALSMGLGLTSNSWDSPVLSSAGIVVISMITIGLFTVPLSLVVGAVLGHLQQSRAPGAEERA